MIREASLASELSRLVVEALVQIGLTEKEVLGGAIEHTDLPWQVPPLIVEAPVFGTALSEYLDRSTYVSIDELLNLYSDAMSQMRHHPAKVLDMEGFRLTSRVAPYLLASERQLIFSLPDNFPSTISDYAGVTFSLECAHLLRSNSKIATVISDDDNYYVTLPDGLEIGVKDGLPTVGGDEWDMPVAGMVQELLRTPRGAVWEGCDHDIIAKVRSVVQTYSKSMRDFEAVDWCLQALRVIDGHRELLHAVRGIKTVIYERTHRLNTLKEAFALMNQRGMSDRQRVESLKAVLVPDILTAGQFSKQLYPFYNVPPPILAQKVLDRIMQRLAEMLDVEQALYGRAVPSKRFN